MSIAAGDPAAGPLSGGADRWRGFVWRHPEWWALGLALGAWAVLIAADLTGHGMPHGGGAGHPAEGGGSPLLAGMVHWQLMVLAMMLPVIVPSLRVAAVRSLWRRRHRGVAGFLVGYLAPWALAGLPICLLLARAPSLSGEWRGEAAAAAFLLAAGWQWAPVKRRALVACHRTVPLAPSGLRADRDCILYGCRIGGWCCLSCWLLMVACTLTGHGSLALLACGGIGFVERYSWRPDMKLLGLGIMSLALVFGPFGLS